MRVHGALFFIYCASACMGGVEGGPGGVTGTGGRGVGGAAGSGGKGGTGGNSSVACVVPPGVVPVQLRRLTEAEYNSTVRDLFPGVALPKIDLVQEIDAKSGFENRASIQNPTALLVEQYNTNAAVIIAGKAVKDLAAVVPCAAADATCGATFVETFGARAFRRPLSAAEKKTYTDFFNQQKAAISFNGAVQLTLEAFLQAPPFLYRVERGDPATVKDGRIRLTGYEMATRLSYLFWGTMPDADLFEAARANKLSTPAQVEAQARRMLKDARLGPAMTEFHRQWLDFDRIDREATKDPVLYPKFTPALKDAIRAESDRFVRGVMTTGDGSLKSLLTSTSTFVNKELADLYGVTAPPGGWGPATLKDTERAGFLTQANYLASHAHTLSGSPPLRAVFVLRHLMCTSLSPPNDADTTPPKAKPGDGPKTNRMLFEERTVGTCQGCHSFIDAIGFGLENYDATGAYRTMEANGLAVDASGEIKSTDVAGKFTGGVELSGRLGQSNDVRLCMTGFWYEYALGRDKDDSDECKVSTLDKTLGAVGGDVREMLIALTKSDEFMYRRVP